MIYFKMRGWEEAGDKQNDGGEKSNSFGHLMHRLVCTVYEMQALSIFASVPHVGSVRVLC